MEHTLPVLAVFSAVAFGADAATPVATALLAFASSEYAQTYLALLSALALATNVSASRVAAFLVLAGRLTGAGGVNAAQGDKVALDL